MRSGVYIFLMVVMLGGLTTTILADEEPRKSLHADSLRIIRTDDAEIYLGYGRVYFRFGEGRILHHADSARLYKGRGGQILYGFGNIHFTVDSTHVKADSVIWYRERDIIQCYGHVEAYDSSQHVWAQRAVYRKADSTLIAYQDVILEQYTDSIRAESQMATMRSDSNVIILEQSPVLFLNFPDEERLVTVHADSMSFYSNEDRGFAFGNVDILQKDVKATCDTAEFRMDEKLLILTGNPFATQNRSDITGDRMDIRFAGSEIDRIEVTGDAKANFVEEADTTEGELSGNSQLSGRTITFFFKNEEVRKIAAMGAARSEYYPDENDTTEAGINLVSGDSIFIYIADRKSNKIEIKGGAEGVYITETDTPLSQDSTANASLTDSLAVPDTTAVADTTTMALDSIPSGPVMSQDSINYRGDFLEFFVKERIIRITGNSVVRQQSVVLKADKVDYDIPRRVVVATAREETVDDSTVVTPLSLVDNTEEIYGTKLVFNTDTKRGLIEGAKTQYEQSYYSGSDLFKEEDKVFYVENGSLTSCDLEEPHFHFQTKKMKLIHNDRAIARPVVFYIETLPVMVIPYYVFPLKRGRHSGILPVKLGNFERGSRYVGNLGYYWAASEYWDVQGSLDFFENTGYTMNGAFRYNKRYAYSGQLNISIAQKSSEAAFSESRSQEWTMSGNHAQTLPYDISFQAAGTYVSTKNYFSDYSTNPDERLNRNVTSKANFNKKFGNTSLSWSFQHINNLDANSKSSQIPSGSFSMPSFQPFGSGPEVDGVLKPKWYNKLYFSYRNSFGYFTNRQNLGDTAHTRKDFGVIDHSISLTGSQNISYFAFGPRVSLTETWYYIPETDQSRAAGIAADAYRRASIAAGIGVNTTIYGTFNFNRLGLLAMRHVLTPSVSFSWSPAVTQHDDVKTFTGRGSGGAKSKSISLSLTQLFQAKVKSGDMEQKLDLLRVSSGASHNFEALGRKWSDLSTSLSSSVVRNLSLTGSLVHDLYDDNDELQWWKPRLKSFAIATQFQAKGSVSDDYVREGLESQAEDDSLQADGSTNGLDYDVTTPRSKSNTAWNVNISHRYAESGILTGIIQKTHWLKVTLNVDLTSNWKVKYSQNYDFVSRQSTEKIVDLYRQLHCWEGHFYWIPNGSRQGYYFKINVSAIPDIKFEKSESGLRGALLNR